MKSEKKRNLEVSAFKRLFFANQFSFSIKKYAFLLTLTSIFCINSKVLAEDHLYKAVDEFSKEKFEVKTDFHFKDSEIPPMALDFEAEKLLKVIKNVREYYTKFSKEDEVVRREGVLGSLGIKVTDVLDTLDYMQKILEEDLQTGNKLRLKDPKFIQENFKVIKWSAYKHLLTDYTDKIRITKYAIFKHEGSKVKTKKFEIPLYKLKEEFKNTSFYKKYTKQEVLTNIYEPKGKEFGKVEPLAYLTREGLEEALMEGTIVVNFTDGDKKFFNVDKNNGIAYVKGLNPRKQKRYWYFRESEAINGYGKEFENRVKIEPNVTFAGDVFNIGLGRMVAYEYNIGKVKYLKLGIIGDTGGAFLPNLFQLDFLAGIFNSKKEFLNYSQNLPEYATVYFLIKKKIIGN